MEFSVTVDAGGLKRRFQFLVDASKDLSGPLRQFGKYLRNKTREAFAQQGPGWPELAESTRQRLEHTRINRITAQGNLRVGSEKALRRKFMKDIKAGKASTMMLREFDRIVGKARQKDKVAQGFHKALQRTSDTHNVTLERLKEDLERYEKKSTKQRRGGQRKSKHRLLGKLSSTIVASVRKNLLVVSSRVPWAGVHNEGGSAGNNARIPARTFLSLDDEDLTVLAHLLGDALIDVFEG